VRSETNGEDLAYPMEMHPLDYVRRGLWILGLCRALGSHKQPIREEEDTQQSRREMSLS